MHENSILKKKKPRRKDPALIALSQIDKKKSKYFGKTDNALDAKMKSMMKLDGQDWICAVCERNFRDHIGHLRNHLESHMEGVSHQCPDCGKIYGSTASMRLHYGNPKRCKNASKVVGPKGGVLWTVKRARKKSPGSMKYSQESLAGTEDVQDERASLVLHSKNSVPCEKH